jgi:hypothetical protein
VAFDGRRSRWRVRSTTRDAHSPASSAAAIRCERSPARGGSTGKPRPAPIPCSPRAVEGKAFIVMIDHISRHPNLTADRVAWIDGRPVYIYANTFQLAARLSVPIVFYCGSMQPDGGVAFMFETPHCVVPKSDEDLQLCLEQYEGFLREQVAAGRA